MTQSVAFKYQSIRASQLIFVQQFFLELFRRISWQIRVGIDRGTNILMSRNNEREFRYFSEESFISGDKVT